MPVEEFIDLKTAMVVVSKLQNSQVMQRALTYNQFTAIGVEGMFRALLKYRDYNVAEFMSTILKQK